MTTRSHLLDLIRILAIGLVAFAHVFQSIGNKTYGGFFGIRNFYWVSWGGVGVTLFLILSGLVLELHNGSRSITFKDFILKRIHRIYPVYWLSLAAAIGVYMLRMWYLHGSPLAFESVTGLDYACSLTGLCVFVGRWGGPFVSTGWFIGLIMIMYLLFPLLKLLVNSIPHITILILLIVSLLSRVYLGSHSILPERAIDWFPTARLFEYGLGIYLAVVIKPTFWFMLHLPAKLASFVTYLSELSFPFFLIHHPMLFVIPHTIKLGFPFILSVIVYLVSCLILSQFIFSLNSRLDLLKFLIKDSHHA